MNRRHFVSTVTQSSLAALLGLRTARLWAQSSGHELPVDCAPPTPGTAKHIAFNTSAPVFPRKSVWDLSATEVTRLQKAYQAMRDLSTSNPKDPRGWMQQANVHCFNCSGGYDPSNVEIHGGWWFLPWHRCYLHVHERILGKLIGDPTFRLAYWDWDTYPAHAVVPPPFLAQGSLLDSYRGATASSVIPTRITGPAAMRIVLGTQGTSAFMGGKSNPSKNIFPSGALESSPHGPVHIWTGETSPGQTPEPPGCLYPDTPGGTPKDQSQFGCLDMGVLATAAQDPIFFSHHSNIDRLWDVWVQTPGSQGNWTSSTWLNHRFNFYDENGDWIYISVADVLAQKEQNNLRYTYQPPQATASPAPSATALPSPSQAPLRPQSVRAKPIQPLMVASDKAVAVGTKPHVQSVSMPAIHSQSLQRLAVGGPREYLHIDGLTLPPNESTILDVFVGDPNANRETAIGPNFVGTFATVVPGHRHMHNVVRDAVFEIRPETAALLAKAKDLTVTLVPRLVNGEEPQKSSLTYKKIYLSQE
jgi:polyphenol oxidase